MPEAAIGSNVVPETFAVQTSVMRAWVFKHRSGTWWTCLSLHVFLLVFYFVWFVVGVTVALWVEIPVGRFGRVVNYTLYPLSLLVGTFFYILLVGSLGLIVLRRPSFFASVQEQIIGALYLLCIYALWEYASEIFDIEYRPDSVGNPKMFIVQMNVALAVIGFGISVILDTIAVVLLYPRGDDKDGAIRLPDDDS